MLAGVVALVALAPACAQAADLVPRGVIVVRWSSNPETCASYGLCNRSGTLAWRPGSLGASIETFGGGAAASLSFFESVAIARSRRETPDGPRVCVEDAPGPTDLDAVPPARGGKARLSLGEDPGLDFGRCAGPLPGDFAAALPRSTRFSPRQLVRRGGTIDMRHRAPFDAGPFTGEVVSTLVIRAKPSPGEQRTERTARAAANGTPSGKLELLYAVDRIAGQMTLGFTGTSEGTCEIFDVCGLHGELAIGGTTMPGFVGISAYRGLRRGREETLAGALRSLRSGNSSAFAESWFGDEDDRGNYPERLAAFGFTERSDATSGPPCADDGRLQITGLSLHTTPVGLTVGVPSGGDERPDDLRTHCPGPESGEIKFGVAEGSLPWSVLGDDEITVGLDPGHGFRSVAFAGAWRGRFDVVLRRVSVNVETLDYPAEP